jgi:hypothetical protein
MSNIGGSSTPAGWYGDPAGSGQLRWWDGAAWTNHLAPVPTPQPVLTPTPTVQPPTVAQASGYSPVADPAEHPYVPFQNSWNVNALTQATQPTQWNTASSWVLATTPLWMVAVELIVILINASMGASVTAQTGTISVITIAVYLVIFLIEILAAVRDHNALKRWGYRTVSSTAWILLGPLIYLIVRTVRVRSEVKRGIAPLVFYIVSIVCIIFLGIAAAVVIPIYLAEHGGASSNSANASSLAAGITNGLDKSGGTYTVTCIPFAQPTSAPTDVTCTAIDTASNDSHTLFIEVDPPATPGGQPTVRLLSVTPPIAQ